MRKVEEVVMGGEAGRNQAAIWCIACRNAGGFLLS
jgi:hypothetical protein